MSEDGEWSEIRTALRSIWRAARYMVAYYFLEMARRIQPSDVIEQDTEAALAIFAAELAGMNAMEIHTAKARRAAASGRAR